jgi:catechol 2,3-dioxygenase-like lactoylglutathione lyase family enzyme
VLIDRKGENTMLSDFTPVTTLPVHDLGAASQFYESVLRFTPGAKGPDGVFYTAGSSRFYVYESPAAGTNQGTAMSFQIPADAFDAELEAVRAAGVAFETFDAPGLTWTDGVASMGEDMRAVWFKDPDGNFLNLETSVL